MAQRRAKRHKRQRRPNRKPPRTGDPRAQRRKAYQRLFRRLGLTEAWLRLPKRTEEHLYGYEPIDWQVTLTRRARGHERAGTIAALVEQVLRDPMYGYPCNGAQVAFREALDLLQPLVRLIEHEPGSWDAERGAALKAGLTDI